MDITSNMDIFVRIISSSSSSSTPIVYTENNQTILNKAKNGSMLSQLPNNNYNRKVKQANLPIENY